jgi:hypothetical protein
MASTHPYYRKWLPGPQREIDFRSDGTFIELTRGGVTEEAPDRIAQANARFDTRAGAAIRAAAGIDGLGGEGPPRIWPLIPLIYILDPTPDQPVHFRRDVAPGTPGPPYFEDRDLLELKWYDDKAPYIHIPTTKCLALLAYMDYFPDNPRLGLGLRSMVSRAILGATQGWCGSFGPEVDGLFSLKGAEGNYDLTQMHLLPMVYRHYDDLSPAAREQLIKQLLERGRVHRPREDDTFTSGGNPNDWDRAGYISPAGYHINIGETENHILMILTTRYLTNQLLYQRDRALVHDNRRNDNEGPSCFNLLMSLLRNMLRGDFSEYNAKSYQSETRWALLNLCTYSYDHEVRLGARMVLDYISAHIAVSTNDLRRLVPFRRRLTDENSLHTAEGFMAIGLLSYNGGDPMAEYFAMQAGNVRAYEVPRPGGTPFGINDNGGDMALEVLSDYRLPPSVHDLFVNDKSRRFFQRLHRTVRNEVGGNRNCDNMEIYAGSPSYLISAGGAPALWAVDPSLHAVIDGETESQQLGVAVTTSFIPTGVFAQDALKVIQFGSFSRKLKTVTRWKFPFAPSVETNIVVPEGVENYGVAPDFACGHQVFLPGWLNAGNSEGIEDGIPRDPRTQGFSFVNMGSTPATGRYTPGFFLAIYQETPGGFALLEAFDTWLHPGVAFSDFKRGVIQRNGGIRLLSNTVNPYETHNGDRLNVRIWSNSDGHDSVSGARVDVASYGSTDSIDFRGGAESITNKLLSGSILNSPEEGRVEIFNPTLNTLLSLDFSDPLHPRRVDSQTGEIEVAGFNNEVWLDFEYQGPIEGDVCRPFNTLDGAASAVADGGVVKIMPGKTDYRRTIGGNKSFRLVAPIGDVTIGTPNTTPTIVADLLEGVSNREMWVQFDFPKINRGDIPYLVDTLAVAIHAVAEGGVINLQPGTTPERLAIGGGKNFALVAPIGGVTIGAA